MLQLPLARSAQRLFRLTSTALAFVLLAWPRTASAADEEQTLTIAEPFLSLPIRGPRGDVCVLKPPPAVAPECRSPAAKPLLERMQSVAGLRGLAVVERGDFRIVVMVMEHGLVDPTREDIARLVDQTLEGARERGTADATAFGWAPERRFEVVQRAGVDAVFFEVAGTTKGADGSPVRTVMHYYALFGDDGGNVVGFISDYDHRAEVDAIASDSIGGAHALGKHRGMFGEPRSTRTLRRASLGAGALVLVVGALVWARRRRQ